MTRSTARLKPTSLQSAAITACLYLCLCLGGQTATAVADGQVTAYVGATLIDGRGGSPERDATVLVENGRFLAVGSEVDIPVQAVVIDVSGKWITPGLIDAHVHFMTSGRMYTRPAFFDLTDKVPYDQEVAWIKAHLPDTLRSYTCAGVTAVLSLGGPSIEYEARALAQTMNNAPSVFIGHGVIAHTPKAIAESMIAPWDGELTIKPVTSASDVRSVIDDAVALKADLIKTAIDDRGSKLLAAMMWWWDWQELEAAMVAEAAEKGLRVTTHTHQLEYARTLVDIGIASLQHVPSDSPVDDAFARSLIDGAVVVVPTLAIRERTFDELFTKDIDLQPIERRCAQPEIIESWYEPLPPHDEQSERYRAEGKMAALNTKALFEAGVMLAAGTDAGMMGLAPGASMHLELIAMNKAGIPSLDVIRAATLNSAKLIGVDDEYGSVESGKVADFLVLNKNPLTDVRNLQSIERVVKAGLAIDPSALIPQ